MFLGRQLRRMMEIPRFDEWTPITLGSNESVTAIPEVENLPLLT